MSSDFPSGAHQENLLTLLCFDPVAAPVIRGVIEVELFDSTPFRDIAQKAISFYDQFREPIGDHLADELDHILSKGDRTSELYERIIGNILDSKDGVNREYILDNLRSFVRLQRLKSALTSAAREVQNDNVDEAEVIISSALNTNIDTFSPGLSLEDPKQALSFYNQDESDTISTGIKEIDDISCSPDRGELYTFMAATGRGKTWAMMHFIKHNLSARQRVLHISLEMSEEKLMRRYMQVLFSLSSRDKAVRYAKFKFNRDGEFQGFDIESMKRGYLERDGMRKKLTKMLHDRKGRLLLRVKQFPMHSLTIPGLKAYLDSLERLYKFVPDTIVIDYADLMKVNIDNLRLDVGRVYKELRGLATERNVRIWTPSQSNRLGEDVKLMSLKHLAEDYSKAATSDGVITYNQTREEEKFGLGRLFVAKNRDNEGGITILVSQAYGIGQFCMDSWLMKNPNLYWDDLNKAQNSEPKPTVTRAKLTRR